MSFSDVGLSKNDYKHDLRPFSNYAVVIGSLVLLSPAVLYVIGFKPILATSFFGGLLFLVLMVNPRVSFALFILLIGVSLPRHLCYLSVQPYDMFFLVAVAGFILDSFLRGGAKIRSAYLDIPFIFLIFGTWLSALFAYDIHESIMPSIRIFVVYLAFRLVFKHAFEIGVRRLLIFLMVLTAVVSVLAFIPFALAGGGIRSFGPAGIALQYLAMITLPMALAFIIWSQTIRSRIIYGIICIVSGLGIFATQSRAPLVAVVFAIPVLLFAAYRKAKREEVLKTARTLKLALIPIILLGVAIIVFGETLFEGTLQRLSGLIASLHHPEGTVSTRLTLWAMAIKGFLSSPFVGIGIGNMRVIHEALPEVKLAPMWVFVKGMSAHNVLLHYLAETGLIGTTALVVLFWKSLRMGIGHLKLKRNARDSQVSVALFIAMFVCFITMFYMRAWTWGQGGYILAFLFALNSAWTYQHQPR